MRAGQRLLVLLAVLATIAGARVAREVYLWYAHGPERDRLRELTVELEDVGLEVVRTELAADSLRIRIEATDAILAGERADLARYEVRAERGALPTSMFREYERALQRYNAMIAERNGRYERWRAIIGRNGDAVDRYNDLAGEIRGVATAIGEPYFPIPTPPEIARRRGLAHASSRAPE